MDLGPFLEKLASIVAETDHALTRAPYYLALRDQVVLQFADRFVGLDPQLAGISEDQMRELVLAEIKALFRTSTGTITVTTRGRSNDA